jgi:predicted DNA binding CopG/RHH family protein
MGFQFTGVDLVKHQAEATLRLSESDLEAAAAGVELEGHLWLMKIVWG